MRCELRIVYKPAGGDAVPLAAITDRRLLAAVAERAIQESEHAATAIAEADPVLGEMQRLEARRLRDLLGTVLPEVTASIAAGASM